MILLIHLLLHQVLISSRTRSHLLHLSTQVILYQPSILLLELVGHVSFDVGVASGMIVVELKTIRVRRATRWADLRRLRSVLATSSVVVDVKVGAVLR